MMSQARSSDLDLSLGQGGGNLIPNLDVGLHKGTGINGPAMERQRGFGCDQSGRSHLFSPQPIMGRNHELRVGEVRL